MCNRKPNCSYNCLIGMALKSSDSGRLPVGEIYRFFEREFPYFLTAAEPWKNSLRHSLSLGHYFRKFNGDKLVTKKGHLWEVDPRRASELDREMYMFLAKGMPEHFGTSQLSKLQLHMTQLLFDSIRNNSSPSLSNSFIHQQQKTDTDPNVTTCSSALKSTIQRPVADVVILTPETVAFSDSVSKQRTNLYPGSSNSVLPTAVPCYGGRQVTPVSTPSRPSVTPLQRTPKGGHLNRERKEHSANREAHNESDKRLQSPVVSKMSEEALQLVQFCNHCTFGLDAVQKSGISDSPNFQIDHENTVQGTDKGQTSKTQNELNDQPSPCIYEDLQNDDDNLTYPFITQPIGHQNLSLSQLNNIGFQSVEPGPPKELTITKPKVQSRMDTCRPQVSLDEAVRPVVYNWNSWWEEKHVLCMMNEESYMNYVECRCEEDIRKILEKNSKRMKKSLKSTVPVKKDSLPAIKEKSTLSEIENTANTTKRSRASEYRGYARKGIKKMGSQKSILSPKARDNKEIMGVCGGDKLADVCKNLKLVVSIQFRKLVTERQMKKYCWEGGKERILTRSK